MAPQVAGSNPVALPLNSLIYLYFLILPFSISLSYIFSYLYFLINRKFSIPKDFIILLALYLWRAISLLANNLSIVPIKEIFDKFVYVIFSNVNISRKVINGILISIFLSNFIILSVGVLDYFFPIFWNKYYFIKTNSYNLELKNREKIAIRNASDRAIEVNINDEKLIIPPNFLIFLKLKAGSYMIASSDSFFLHTKTKISDNIFYIRNFWNETNNFMGLVDHKLVAATIFSILTVLFFCAFLYFNKLYFLAFLTSLISLILTFSKSYIPITILILFLILFIKKKNITLLVSTMLAFAIFSIILLKFKPEFYNAFNLRNNFYKAGIEIFQKNPIFGIGYSNVSNYLEDYLRKGMIDNHYHTHNIYIDALAETGILGLILFLITYLYFGMKFLNKGYKNNNFLSIAVGWCIILIMLTGFFEKNVDRAAIDLLLFSLMGIANSLNKD